MFKMLSVLLVFIMFAETHESVASSRKQDIKRVLSVFGLKKPGNLFFSMIPPAYIDTDSKAIALANFIEKGYLKDTNFFTLFDFSPKQIGIVLSRANYNTMPHLTWLNLTSDKPGIGSVIASKLSTRPFPNLHTLRYIPEYSGESIPLIETLFILPNTLESLEILIHNDKEEKALIEALKKGRICNIKKLTILYSDKINKLDIEEALKNKNKSMRSKITTNLTITKW